HLSSGPSPKGVGWRRGSISICMLGNPRKQSPKKPRNIKSKVLLSSISRFLVTRPPRRAKDATFTGLVLASRKPSTVNSAGDKVPYPLVFGRSKRHKQAWNVPPRVLACYGFAGRPVCAT